MLARVRDAGPSVLVPLAWLVVAGAHRGLVSETALLIAHLVMAGFIAMFALTGWSEMATGALRAWRAVLVVGLGVTIAGIVGFTITSQALLGLSIVGWMLLPALGLVYTGRLFSSASARYYASGALSAVGAAVYVASVVGSNDTLTLVGIALVALGQSAGILDATLRE